MEKNKKQDELDTKHKDTYYCGPTENTVSGREQKGQLSGQASPSYETEMPLYPSRVNDHAEAEKEAQRAERRRKGIASIDSHTVAGDND